jgi:hypothetical protein
MQVERLSAALASYGVDPKGWPTAAIILMLSGISRYLRTEESFGLDIGHAETIAFVDGDSLLAVYEIDGDVETAKANLRAAQTSGTMSRPVGMQLDPPPSVRYFRSGG